MTFKNLTSLLITILLVLIGFYYILVQKKSFVCNKPLVVCTTTIIADAIKNIATNTINLKILMGPGVDPHTYKPVEQDIIMISNAQIIFYHGLHLEACMADIFTHMSPNKITIAVTADIAKEKLIYSSEFDHYADPHVWFEPELWILAVQTITKHLQKFAPQYYDLYENNKNTYIQKILKTYDQTKNLMSKIPKAQRILITGHDAFSYFARAYDCKVISLQGISTASEAGTGDLLNLINFIVHHKIKTIFPESCMPTRSMQALIQGAQSFGCNVQLGHELFSDSLGSPGSMQESYCDMLSYNVQSLSLGLL